MKGYSEPRMTALWSIDLVLLSLCVAIPILGLVVLYSAGFDPNYSRVVLSWPHVVVNSPAFLKQSGFFLISLLVGLVVVCIPIKWWFRCSPGLYACGILLLIAVGVRGSLVNGSRRWIQLAGVNIQPAEFVKLCVIFLMARYLAGVRWKETGARILELIVPAIILVLPMVLILKQPDLGTAISVGVVGAGMVWFMGIRTRTLVVLVCSALLAMGPLWYRLHPYQKNRILALFYPDSDPQGTGYHIKQSKIAIGSGELLGKGYLNGTQSQLEFLPEHTTDFVFSVLAEEWGFIGCSVILGLYLLLLCRLLHVASKCDDLFSELLVFGVASSLFFHIFVNVGMVIGILPVVGIPLPLFSYGGSSFMVTMFSLAVVLRVSLEMRRREYRYL
jgi:rod shape determining protein RodA